MEFAIAKNFLRFTNRTALALLIGCFLGILSCQYSTRESGKSQLGQASFIFDTAVSLLNGGSASQAIHFLNVNYAKIDNPNRIQRWGKYNFQFNYYLNYEKDLKKSSQMIDSMFATLQGSENTYIQEYVNTVYANGDLLMAQKEYDNAFKSYRSGRLFAEKQLDSCSWGELSQRMGIVRYRQANFLKAIPYFKQSVLESSHCIDSRDFHKGFLIPQSSLNAMALSFEKTSQPDSAIYYYNKTLSFITQKAAVFPEQKQFMESAKGVVYGNMGGVYAERKEYRNAERYLKESIQINTRPGNALEDATTALIKLAALYLEQNRVEDSKPVLDRIGAILSLDEKKLFGNLMRLKWYELQSQYYYKTGQQSLGVAKELQSYKFRDSVDATERGIKIIDLDKRQEEIEQDYKLNLLKKNDQLKSTVIQSTVVCLILIMFILLLVWKNLKKSKKDVSLLTSLNQKISEQNNSLLKVLASLEQSQEENTKMMKIVAHDLRNPVGGISMIASLMLQDQNLSPQDRTSLEMIHEAGESSMEMIQQLLQIQRKGENLKTEDVDLAALLHRCVNFMRLKAAQKSQTIQIETEKQILSLNREKIWRLLSNLITNAIKFSPPHSEIWIRMQKKDNQILLSVEDQGVGIPPRMSERIFDMYTNTKRTGTEGEETFGMGLAISKQIAESHNGKIWFENRVGAGAVFYVALPIPKRFQQSKSSFKSSLKSNS